MIAIKRVCKFFDHCKFADNTSRTCIVNAGGDYCGAYRIQEKLQEGTKKGDKMDTSLAYQVAPEVIEMHRKQLEKEEREAKDLVHLINTDALRGLCTRYDNKEGAYPEHVFEGAAFLEYVEDLNTEVEKENKIAQGTKKGDKKVLLISNYDEWWGPIYTCPFCTDEHIMDDFNFCPNCAGNLAGLRFETPEEGEKRMKKENDK